MISTLMNAPWIGTAMMKLKLIGQFLLMASCWAFGFADYAARPTPCIDLRFHAQLDDNYDLYWDFNETHITFQTIVRTNGFTGFGISPNGGMPDSDVIVGWVKNGQPHFADRHTLGRFMPIIDDSQDWTLLEAKETGNYTSLKFTRLLETCDAHDRPILNGTNRIIYSYNPNDPDDDNSIMYHGLNRRGTKSLLLLDPPREGSTNEFPDDVITLDFLNGNFSVPAKDTTYHCLISKIPDLGQKHHIIRFEPIIQTGHENLVHHMGLRYCSDKVDDIYVGDSFLCYEIDHPASKYCASILIAWAIGGTAFNIPLDIGISLGAPGDPIYFILETHYDNPTMRDDFVDNSGFRLTLTPTLREIDAGFFVSGSQISPLQIIPPYYESFISTGYCLEGCINQAFGDQEEVTIFGAFLHSHLLGRKIRARHFRQGVELAPIAEDNSYDFNFQEFRSLNPRRILQKGDRIVVECDYDSTGRDTITYGGLGTYNEMCEAFFMYYPKVPLVLCVSVPNYNGSDVFTLVNNTDWTQAENREEFIQIVRDSSISTLCIIDVPPEAQIIANIVPALNISDPSPPPENCPNLGSN